MKPFLDFDWQRVFQVIPIKQRRNGNWLQKVEIKLIDRKAVKAQQNKMATRGESNSRLIQSLIVNVKKQKHSTKNKQLDKKTTEVLGFWKPQWQMFWRVWRGGAKQNSQVVLRNSLKERRGRLLAR